MTVHIICSIHNGARFIEPFVESLRRQTFAEWGLLVRDDGSSDDSPAIVDRLAAADRRIQVIDRSRTPLGVPRTFARLLDLAPTSSDYILFADIDDIWLPDKIELTVAAMQRAERASPGPILVCTDLTVVDENLGHIADSFWEYTGVDPAAVTLRQIAVRNMVPGASAAFNRALRELASPIPPEAAMHDWWVALVAAAFGRIIPLPDRTLLYRQHGDNSIGAARPLSVLSPRQMLAQAATIGARTRRMRANIVRAGAQSAAFLDRFDQRLPAADREFLQAYARLPALGLVARKRELLRLQCLPENSWLQDLGILLRA